MYYYISSNTVPKYSTDINYSWVKGILLAKQRYKVRGEGSCVDIRVHA